MLVWPMAAMAPSTMDSTEMKIDDLAPLRGGVGKRLADSARRNSAMAAILGDMAKKAVTGVGAPS